jgi:hypothetical protein
LLISTMQDGEILGCGQIRNQGQEFELSSLVVKKEMRGMVTFPDFACYLAALCSCMFCVFGVKDQRAREKSQLYNSAPEI